MVAVSGLTVTEARTLEACESDLLKGGELIVDALRTIRDGRLHRVTHDSFDEYCKEKWGLTDRHVRRLIDHSDVLANIAEMTGPIGPVQNGPKGPVLKERAAREIKDLPADKQREVVQKVVSEGKPLTTKIVKEARQEIAPKPERTLPPVAEPEPLEGGKPGGHARAHVIMQIRLACREADQWTDEECREEVADELASQLKRFRVVTVEVPKASGKFVKPTQEEVAAYVSEKDWTHLVDAEDFIAHYSANGWRTGKGGIPMKDWRAAVLTWVKTAKKESASNGKKVTGAVAVPAGKYDHIDNAK